MTVVAILLAWLKLPAPDGDLARAEPNTLRYRDLTMLIDTVSTAPLGSVRPH